jgi:hypothetical protein
MPWFSGWSFLVFPAIGGDSFITNSYTGFTEVKEELAEYIVDNTSEDQIIHVMGDINLGVILAFHTGRPTDTAAWPEVRPVKGAAYVNAYAETDPEGVYVSRDPGQLPDDLSPRRFGSYYVAIRGGPVRLNSPR